MTPQPSFQTFLAWLREGNDLAVQQLMDRFRARLECIARRKLGARARQAVDPEDIMNSAVRSVWRKLSEGHYEDKVTDWEGLWGLLNIVTLRKCKKWRDALNALKRGGDLQVQHPQAEEARAWDPADDAAENPEEKMVMEETLAVVTRGLDAEQLEMVNCAAVSGLDIGEISRKLGCDYHRVWRTLDLVRKRLIRLRDED